MTTDALDVLVNDASRQLAQVDSAPTLERVLAFSSWKRAHDLRARMASKVVAVGVVLHVLGFAWLSATIEVPSDVDATTLHAALSELAFGLGLPVLAALATVALSRRTSYAAQVFARAALWGACMTAATLQLLLSEVDVLTATAPIESGLVIVWTVVAGVAAWVLGDEGLQTPRGGRRGPLDALLSLSLIMGIADAVVLLVIVSFFSLVAGPVGFGIVAVLSAGLVVGAVGLFRGRVWGLLVMALCNLAELAAVSTGTLVESDFVLNGIGPVLGLTAVIQLVLPVPVYLAMFRGSRGWVERLSRRAPSIARALSAVALIVIAAPSVLMLLLL